MGPINFDVDDLKITIKHIDLVGVKPPGLLPVTADSNNPVSVSANDVAHPLRVCVVQPGENSPAINVQNPIAYSFPVPGGQLTVAVGRRLVIEYVSANGPGLGSVVLDLRAGGVNHQVSLPATTVVGAISYVSQVTRLYSDLSVPVTFLDNHGVPLPNNVAVSGSFIGYYYE